MTDIKMPGLSGLKLIQRIKKVHPDVEFIILSGYGEFEFAREAMQYGVHHYLLKPCKEEQIVESVEKTMDEISRKRFSGALTPGDISRGHMETTMILNIINELVAKDADSDNDDFFRPIACSMIIWILIRKTCLCPVSRLPFNIRGPVTTA